MRTMTLTFAILLAGCATAAPEPDPAARMVLACETALGGRQQPAFDNCLIQQLQVFAASQKALRETAGRTTDRRAILGLALIGAGSGIQSSRPPTPVTPQQQFCRPIPYNAALYCYPAFP